METVTLTLTKNQVNLLYWSLQQTLEDGEFTNEDIGKEADDLDEKLENLYNELGCEGDLINENNFDFH